MRKQIVMLTAVMLLVVFLPGGTGAQDLIPTDMPINDIYQRGVGKPVGTVVMTQGEVVILHKGEAAGYRAQKGLDLFQMDTLICRDKGRALIEMIDGSRLTLASRTRLTLNRSVYDETLKDRSSFFRMALGKTRFWITKLTDFKRSEVRVLTPTAVVGVRGSDFVVAATATTTRVTTLDDTELEVANQFLPELAPLVLNDFQQTVVESREAPTPAIDIDPAQAADIVQDVPVVPQQDDGAVIPPGQKQALSATATGKPQKTDEAETEEQILFEEEALLAPEQVPDATPPPPLPVETGTGGGEQQDLINTIQELQDTALQETQEETAAEEMPDFPAPPQN